MFTKLNIQLIKGTTAKNKSKHFFFLKAKRPQKPITTMKLEDLLWKGPIHFISHKRN